MAVKRVLYFCIEVGSCRREKYDGMDQNRWTTAELHPRAVTMATDSVRHL